MVASYPVTRNLLPQFDAAAVENEAPMMQILTRGISHIQLMESEVGLSNEFITAHQLLVEQSQNLGRQRSYGPLDEDIPELEDMEIAELD